MIVIQAADWLLGHIIIDTQDIVHEISQETDFWQRKDVPHRSRQRSTGSALAAPSVTRHTGTQKPCRGMESAMMMPSGTSMAQDDAGEQELAAKGGVKPF